MGMIALLKGCTITMPKAGDGILSFILWGMAQKFLNIASWLSNMGLGIEWFFMAYSTVMSVIWALLESPDLAITEAAVGAGVTSILFFVTLKKIKAVEAFEINTVSDDGSDDRTHGTV